MGEDRRQRQLATRPECPPHRDGAAGSSTAAVRGNTAPRSTAPWAGPRSAATPPRRRPPRRLPAGGPRGDPLHPGPGGGAGDGCRCRRGLRDVCLAAWLRSVHGRGRLRCHQVRGGETKSRRIPIDPAPPAEPPTVISCLGAFRTSALSARRYSRHAGPGIVPRPCIRSIRKDRDHDAVMRIGGEAPGQRARICNDPSSRAGLPPISQTRCKSTT